MMTAKLCKDCRYFVGPDDDKYEFGGILGEDGPAACIRHITTCIDLVYGGVRWGDVISCSEARNLDSSLYYLGCGEEGKFWEPK